MAFTRDNNLEQPTEGSADWDTSLNSNFDILERGRTIKASAATNIVSGQVCTFDSAAAIVPYDASSVDLAVPPLMSYSQVNSGEEGFFLQHGGIVRSMDVWSGHLSLGEPAYVSPASPGFLVSSAAGTIWPVGYALDEDAVTFQPHNPFPYTVVASAVGGAERGANFDFSLPLGVRGIVRKIRVLADSCDAHKVLFHSASTRTNSELLYETATTSVDGGAADFDVNTLDFLDAAGVPFVSTDANSIALIYGRVSVQSASAVGSEANFRVDVLMERFL